MCITGAGISADSGIPTFRGEEGYWREGSSVFTPMQMATRQMFETHPERVWRWYRMRLGVCRGATPNQGHHQLVALQKLLGDRLTLVTQNVDGLHGRSGFHGKKLFEIHGNIEIMRCSDSRCHYRCVHPPLDGQEFSLADYECPSCGKLMRPHVLWFDECYNEVDYKAESSARAAYLTDLLVVCGTSGSTSLPFHLAEIALSNGAFILDINPEENPFSSLADRYGEAWKTNASKGLSSLVEQFS